jgi:hypothetical protein
LSAWYSLPPASKKFGKLSLSRAGRAMPPSSLLSLSPPVLPSTLTHVGKTPAKRADTVIYDYYDYLYLELVPNILTP